MFLSLLMLYRPICLVRAHACTRNKDIQTHTHTKFRSRGNERELLRAPQQLARYLYLVSSQVSLCFQCFNTLCMRCDRLSFFLRGCGSSHSRPLPLGRGPIVIEHDSWCEASFCMFGIGRFSAKGKRRVAEIEPRGRHCDVEGRQSLAEPGYRYQGYTHTCIHKYLYRRNRAAAP